MPDVPAPLSRGVRLGGGRTRVMGILNVTPDSFSDGGLWLSPESAVSRGQAMWDQGAFLVDVGGESTRPGAARVSASEEWQRIGGVIVALVHRGVAVSVDTVNAETARRAAAEGAALINDVSGGSYDPYMGLVAAQTQVALVVQHWRGFPSDPELDSRYDQVTDQVIGELGRQIAAVRKLGVAGDSVVVDPGLGFAKGADDSWALLSDLDRVVSCGYPVLVGASRKRFVRQRFGEDVDGGTAQTTLAAAAAGAWAVRVHDVARNVRLLEDCE